MKSVRHAVIKEIIESQEIETQEELAAALRARNIDVTQATVSRDIKELRLLKVLSDNGGYKYATADKAEHGLADRFIRIFNESVLSITPAGNLIVVRTLSGSANAAGEAVDSLKWSEIVGTISGDNTLLVIAQNEQDVAALMRKFERMKK
ncbi:MAG: arginine repressor [Candidatus Spyradocola sp.]|jgi:transcriptional regulator of arginine metabolism